MSMASRRYAVSLFEAAKEEQVLEQVYEDFTAFIQVYREDNELYKLFALHIVPIEEKKKVLSKVFSKNTLLKNMMYILLDKGRIEEIYSIYLAFKDCYLEELGILEVLAVSACELDEESRNALKGKLEKKYGKTVVLNIQVEPSILGGLVLYLGDRVLDLSIRHKLTQLRQQLKQTKVI